MSASACPGCGSLRLRTIGPIPAAGAFAGRAVKAVTSDLVICRDCHLGFRSPQPSLETLAAWYESGAHEAWTAPAKRRLDWELAERNIARLGVGSVLDVGCFDGAFLARLPQTLDRAGIEINQAAAERAREQGIRIVAADLHELADHQERFDCVVAFDVLEHVHDPQTLLASLAGAARPGGHVIVATGNLDAASWRVMGSRYLYCWFQEHIAFASPRWLANVAPGLGLEVVSVEKYSPRPGPRRGLLVGAAKNVAYRLAPRLVNRSRSGVLPGAEPAPPAWAAARDHFIAVLRVSA